MSRRIPHLFLALLLLSPGINAADNPGAHEHGHAQLQLAIDGSQVELFLLSPAVNLAGFEHAPRTPEQRRTMDELAAWSRQTPLVNTRTGTCSVQSHSLHASWSGHQEDHNHQHADDQEHAGHADLEISQTLTCPDLDGADTLVTPLTTHFTRMEKLDVQWVGPAGQGAAQLTADEDRFNTGD